MGIALATFFHLSRYCSNIIRNMVFVVDTRSGKWGKSAANIREKDNSKIRNDTQQGCKDDGCCSRYIFSSSTLLFQYRNMVFVVDRRNERRKKSERTFAKRITSRCVMIRNKAVKTLALLTLRFFIFRATLLISLGSRHYTFY